MDGDAGRAAAGTDDARQSSAPPPKSGRAKYVVFLLVLLAAAGAGGWHLWSTRDLVSTDDAFIDGDVAAVAPRVAGQVASVLVADNQLVEAGEKLVEIDPRDLQVALDQARARAENAAAALAEQQARATAQQASLDQASADARVSEADLTQARQDFQRYSAINPQAITRQTLDNASATLRAAEARLQARQQAVAVAEAQVKTAAAQIKGATASLREAEVAVDKAELQLSYASITAPVAGRVTKRTAVAGNYVKVGAVLLNLVPAHVWVTANFKESQLARLRAGQSVEIAVDAYPDTVFRGHVDSFQSGTGSVFATLPPENATGNYVKVVQRLPVKILFDTPPPAGHGPGLVPGMSVVPTVKAR